MDVVLVNPEIAPNTGNIIRLCAITGNRLHLVEPLGFDMDDRLLRRGGLDYREHAEVEVHPDLTSTVESLTGRKFAFSSHAALSYADVEYAPDDALVFGSERCGLGDAVLSSFPDDQRLTIPMMPGNRSLNLANAVSIVVYEAWRQAGFTGSSPGGAESGLTSERPGSPPFDR